MTPKRNLVALRLLGFSKISLLKNSFETHASLHWKQRLNPQFLPARTTTKNIGTKRFFSETTGPATTRPMTELTRISAKKNPGVQRAIEIAGGQVALADECGVSHAAVAKWLWRSCPAKRAVQIEEKTGVDRAEIRPDLYQR